MRNPYKNALGLQEGKLLSNQKAEAFNAFTTDWKNRIEKLLNTVIILSGGVMSITIGAYINDSPPDLSIAGANMLRYSWYLLASSLAASLLVHFFLVISGAIVLKQWEKRISFNKQGIKLIDSPRWLHLFSWALAVWAVIACLLGLVLMAYGASYLLPQPQPQP